MQNVAQPHLQFQADVPSAARSREPSGALQTRDEQIKQAWGDLLNPHPWVWFVTLTFPDFPHPERAFKQYRVWICKLNRRLYGTHFHQDPRKGTVWICGVEYQKRGSIHFHALAYAPGRHHEMQTLRRTDWARQWQQITGGFAMIVEPNVNEAVARYCSKYAAKGGEIEFSPTFNKERQAEAVHYLQECRTVR